MADQFIRRYDQMHRVVMEPDQTVSLYIGADNWPLPIPIVKNSSGAWYFDTEAGAKEILYRRIGRNENDAIEVLYTLGMRSANTPRPTTMATRPNITL